MIGESLEPARASAEAPYADLHPDIVLDALDAVGLRGDGRLIQLNSYENRVFQVFLEDAAVVVAKFYRPARWSNAQILEEHAFAAELASHEIPVAPALPLTWDAQARHAPQVKLRGPTLAELKTASGTNYRFSVSLRLAGRAPELETHETLAWIGRFIGRMHAVGAITRFATRLELNSYTFGAANRDWLLAHAHIAPDALPHWQQAVNTALVAVEAAFAAHGPPRTLRLHGDCHLGNILWTPQGPHFVDFDDAVNGPAIQDLWMLLSGERATQQRQLGAVLSGYESFMDFDRRELRLIEPLRTLRQIHHSAWLARRWNDPAFPPAFPWFASPAYWAEQTTRLHEQIEAMAEAPLDPT